MTTQSCVRCQPRGADGQFVDEDRHVPPVCVCATPQPDGLGECQDCLRPYKPQVPGFDACRRAWLARLGAVA